MNAIKNALSRVNWLWATIVGGGLLMLPLIAPVIAESSPTTTTTPPPAVLVGDTDPNPPVIKGGAASWEELFQKVGDNPAYWTCFTARTGHSKEEAIMALAREREGWNVAVTLVSNTSVTSGDAALDSKGLPRDPDVVQLNGFSNTRGAGEGNCQAFDDSRAQVRVALTLPGKDAQTPGLPVALSHCGNPIGYPQGPPPPATSTPPSHGQPTPPSGPKPPVPPKPPVVPPTIPHPPTTVKCAVGPYCDPTGNLPGNPSTQTPTPLPPTPGPSTEETQQAATNSPTNGYTRPDGTVSSGGSTGSNGSQTGGTAGVSNIVPTEGTGATSGTNSDPGAFN